MMERGLDETGRGRRGACRIRGEFGIQRFIGGDMLAVSFDGTRVNFGKG